MIIYWVWRSNINIPLAWVCSEAPPSKYYLWPGNKWAEVAQNEGWFRNRGTHSGLVNDGDCWGEGGQHSVHALHFILSRECDYKCSYLSDHDIGDKYGLILIRQILSILHTWDMKNAAIQCHVQHIAALCRGHIVFLPWHVICFNPNFRYRSHNQAGPDGICDRQQQY